MPSYILKMRFKVLAALALLFVFAAAPSPGYSAVKKMAVLPWEVRSADGMEYLREALSGMLNSRLGAHDDISIVRADRLKAALKGLEDKEINPDNARSMGRELEL
ncbi:MAG: hypothetical protein ACE5DR_04375, partial [Thermodesulfobacteriota bacterium]